MRVQTTVRLEHSDHCALHRIAKRERIPAQRLIEAGIRFVLAANGMPVSPARVNGSPLIISERSEERVEHSK